ncbi:MAG: hypothetical protein ACTHJV_07175 [Rhizobiaceae bacterium]
MDPRCDRLSAGPQKRVIAVGRFADMPVAAIDLGTADIILPPAKIARALEALASGPMPSGSAGERRSQAGPHC